MRLTGSPVGVSNKPEGVLLDDAVAETATTIDDVERRYGNYLESLK